MPFPTPTQPRPGCEPLAMRPDVASRWRCGPAQRSLGGGALTPAHRRTPPPPTLQLWPLLELLSQHRPTRPSPGAAVHTGPTQVLKRGAQDQTPHTSPRQQAWGTGRSPGQAEGTLPAAMAGVPDKGTKETPEQGSRRPRFGWGSLTPRATLHPPPLERTEDRWENEAGSGEVISEGVRKLRTSPPPPSSAAPRGGVGGPGEHH